MNKNVIQNLPQQVQNVLAAMRDYDYSLYSHSVRVGVLAGRVADALGIESEYCRVARIAGFVHDYGKLKIPVEVLNAPRQLTEAEQIIIRGHVLAGLYDLYLRDSFFFSPSILVAVAQHHENLDGSGYPFGLKQISLTGKILRVCDAFDALTHARSYKPSFNLRDSFCILKTFSGTQYDEEVIKGLESIIKDNEFAIADLCRDYF